MHEQRIVSQWGTFSSKNHRAKEKAHADSVIIDQILSTILSTECIYELHLAPTSEFLLPFICKTTVDFARGVRYQSRVWTGEKSQPI